MLVPGLRQIRLFFLIVGGESGRPPIKHSVPHGKLVAYKSYIYVIKMFNSELIQAPYKTASLLSHQYFHTLRNKLDKHAPVHESKTTQHVNKGFINSEISAAKRHKRKL